MNRIRVCCDLPECAIRIQLNSPDEILNEHVLDHCSGNDPVKFGNINQKPLEQTLPQSQPEREDRQAFPCLQAGCKKICKPLGGLALHVKWENGAKTT